MFWLKNHSDNDQFFSGLENYVLLYLDTKPVYHISGTDEPFTAAKYKEELSKPYIKIFFLSLSGCGVPVQFIQRIFRLCK